MGDKNAAYERFDGLWNLSFTSLGISGSQTILLSSSVESGKTTVGAARLIDAKMANMFLLSSWNERFNISRNNKRYHHFAVALEQTCTELAKELLLQEPS